MALNSLKDVYQDQLQDLYSSCRQSIEATRQLGEAAHNEELKKALAAGVKGIADGMNVIEEICGEHGVDQTGEFCRGMEGLVKEAHAHGIKEDFGDPDAQDAMIITQYQRMTHYAIAGYGCCVAFANRLGLDADGRRLQECLDQTKEGDVTMSQLATGGINASAA